MNLPPPNRQTGVALVLVLWILGLMTIMAGSYSLTTHREAELLHHAHERTKALALADAGIHYAMLMLNLQDTKSRWRTDGEPYYWETEGARVRIQILDEGGKIDLNAAQEPTLKKLLSLILHNEDQATRLTDVIIDWRDVDNIKRPHGAETEDYQAAGMEQKPRNRNFLTMEEFRGVLGITPELYQKLEPWFTLYTGQEAINPMKATRDILLVLSGGDIAAVNNYLMQRRQTQANNTTPPGQSGQAPMSAPVPFASQSGLNLQGGSDMAYTIFSQVEISGQPVAGIKATVKRNSGRANAPFLFLNWKESGFPRKPVNTLDH